jgi:O-antigen ligase
MIEKLTQEFPRDSKLDRVIFLNLLATVVLSVLAFGTVEPWSIAIFEINALVVAVLLALRFAIDPDPEWRRLRLALPVFALLIWGGIQMTPIGSPAATATPESAAIGELGAGALSRDPQATREAVMKLLALAIYFSAALLALRDARRRKVVQILLTGFGFLVSVFAIVHRLTSNGKMYWVRPVSDYIAPYGPFGNYNHFAGFIELILPLPLAYVLLARINLEQRLIWLFSVVMMAVAVIFSLSRGGILALGVEVLALLAIATFGRKWVIKDEHGPEAGNAIVILAALAAIAVIALWIGYDRLVERFNATRQGASELSVVTRVEYWRASWRMFLDHPVAGVGLGAFPAVYPNYGRSSAMYERLEQTHNDYLQLLTDAGSIGAALGLWFLFEVARLARRQFRKIRIARSRARAIIIGGYVAVLGLLAHGFTDFNLQITSNALLFLFVLALTTSVSFHTSRETR